jgi:hypothetical protein
MGNPGLGQRGQGLGLRFPWPFDSLAIIPIIAINMQFCDHVRCSELVSAYMSIRLFLEYGVPL